MGGTFDPAAVTHVFSLRHFPPAALQKFPVTTPDRLFRFVLSGMGKGSASPGPSLVRRPHTNVEGKSMVCFCPPDCSPAGYETLVNDGVSRSFYR